MNAGSRNTGNAMPVPLHLQIQADIMGAIERGDFPVGEQLPSEAELQVRYGVSRATIRNIRQNLFWAFAYNIVGIPFAAGVFYAFGGPLLTPMFAGAAMALSSVSVVSNALLLNRWKPRT